MSEAGYSTTSKSRASARVDRMCNSLRDGLNAMVDAFTPPESASRHFREARVEMLRGIRALIDHRIERLSHPGDTGTRVPVE
jgi:hypothetical protein